MKRFALAGNPNSGKTTVFNALTGSTAHVGNWPGVTVDKKDGYYKKGSEVVQIIDLPGIYSLSPYTPEEVVSRNYILDEKPDCVINIVDATNLERNLYLTTQLMEMDVPVVVALNMMDALTRDGDTIDAKLLEERLGLPVVEVSALRGKGLKDLCERAIQASNTARTGTTVVQEKSVRALIDQLTIQLREEGVNNPLFHAVKLAERDEIEYAAHPKAAVLVEEYVATLNSDVDFEAVVADHRYRYITKNYSPTLKRSQKLDRTGKKPAETRSAKIDKVLTHRFWGLPIFLVILFFVFHLTFSEDLFFLGAMGMFDGVALPQIIGGKGICSPGVILFNCVDALTSLLSDTVSSALSSAPAWIGGLVCDGILAGVFSVLSFLPQILLLFLFFSILEDTGYMARVAFILDKLFRKFGLSGRAFLPMIMGFGCSVPAMINTRTLADKNERISTLRVIPFFSCGAKLPILTAIAGAIVQAFGVGNVDLITYGMYGIGIVTAVVTVLLMRNTTMKGEIPPFIMELPTYHMPLFRNLMIHLWDKAKHFIQKAFTIILASTVVIWFVSHFSFSWKFLEDADINQSILAGIGQIIQPLFTPLGFGSQLGGWGWVFAVAAITGLIAKENVIATFGTLAACITAGFIADEALEGVDSVIQMIGATGIGVSGLIAFIVFNMTTLPCFAAVAAARAELPTKKSFRLTLAFWLATSYLLSTAVYVIGRWWWTSFIVAALIAGAIALVILYNKGKLPKFVRKEKVKKARTFGCGCGCSDCSACSSKDKKEQ